MKPRKRVLVPLGLVVLGGLLMVGALAMLAMLPRQAPLVPTPSSPPQRVAEDSIPRVSVGDAKAAYDLKQAVFIDARAKVFYDEEHIPGALSIPSDELESRLGELNKEDWITLYCT